MRMLRIVLLGLLVATTTVAATAVVTTAVVTPASAQEGEKAKEEPSAEELESRRVEKLRAEADAFAKKRRFRKAIPKYKEVLQLRPYDYPAIYYNMAEMSRFLEDFNEAALFYQRYLELEPEAKDRRAIEKSIAQCKKRRGPGGALKVSVTGPPDVLMVINGIPMADVLSKSFEVAPGQYKIRLLANDFVTQERDVTVTAGASEELAFEMKAVPYFGSLVAVINLEGAEVFVDGKKVGDSPLKEPVKLSAGKRFVEVKKDGYHRWVRNVIIERDAQYDLTVKLGKMKQVE